MQTLRSSRPASAQLVERDGRALRNSGPPALASASAATTARPPKRVAATRDLGRHQTFDRVLSIALIAPSTLAIGVFVYGFIAWTAWVSLTNWNGLVPFTGILPNVDFVGLQTYERLFQN